MGLSMLGDKLSAEKAEQWGLIWQCVPDDAFDARLDELARHFADAPTKGLAYTKRALTQSLANSLDDQLDLKRDLMRELGARSEEHTSELQSLMRSSYPVLCL